MRKFTDQEILDRVAGLRTFKGFPNGMMDVCVRSAAPANNRFVDKIFTYECFGSSRAPVFKLAAIGTTTPGTYGLLNFRLWQPKGCAVLLPDQIVYDSHVYGLHKKKPGYVQVKGIPYTRDNDRDLRAEHFGPIYTDVIAANRHRAGRFSHFINNWSVACIVNQDEKVFLRWLEIMNRRPLTLCILREF